MKCIIVEDEPLAREVLRDYIAQVPHLDLVGEYEDAIYALEGLPGASIDVIFLDIHLPKLKGLDFLRLVKNPPQVILTTAYHQYALKGFDLNVVDYLLKPIEYDRFLQAVGKLRWADQGRKSKNEEAGYRFFRVNRTHQKIKLDDILFVESLRDYVRIHTAKESFVTKERIGALTQSLAPLSLLRIHRSYAVAKEHINGFTGSEVVISGRRLPIGRSYRALVKKQLVRW